MRCHCTIEQRSWRRAVKASKRFPKSGVACLWDKWTDPETAAKVVSFSMLTVNADQHPVMRQFHKPSDEKRTPVIIKPELHEHWLSVDVQTAHELMTWAHMPELSALPAPRA